MIQEPNVSTPENKPNIILEELRNDEQFLRENQLDEVYDWINVEGWENLFMDDEQVDKELVTKFYKKVSKIAHCVLELQIQGPRINRIKHTLGIQTVIKT